MKILHIYNSKFNTYKVSLLNKKIDKKSFAGATALVFLISFFAFNAYTGYELSRSKLDGYRSYNDFHAKRVNAKIVASFEGISELKYLEKQSENYALASLDNRKAVAVFTPVESVSPIVSSNSESLQTERPFFKLEKASTSNKIDFTNIEDFAKISISPGEIVYALESKSKRLNFYLGLAVIPKLGILNYNNPSYSKNFTADIFEEHTSAAIKWTDESLVIGLGGQVFGGVMFSNGISIEGGVTFSEISGKAAYRFEHKYIREVERLEWVVTGEDEAEALVTKDYVEALALDTVSSTFSRSSFNLPLTLNYSFDFGRIKPFVSAGISWNVVTSGNQNIYSSFQRKSSIVEESLGVNQLNLQAGIGVDIEISNRFIARIKPAIDFGVWNKNPEYLNGNLRDLSIQTGFYYTF